MAEHLTKQSFVIQELTNGSVRHFISRAPLIVLFGVQDAINVRSLREWHHTIFDFRPAQREVALH